MEPIGYAKGSRNAIFVPEYLRCCNILKRHINCCPACYLENHIAHFMINDYELNEDECNECICTILHHRCLREMNNGAIIGWENREKDNHVLHLVLVKYLVCFTTEIKEEEWNLFVKYGRGPPDKRVCSIVIPIVNFVHGILGRRAHIQIDQWEYHRLCCDILIFRTAVNWPEMSSQTRHLVERRCNDVLNDKVGYFLSRFCEQVKRLMSLHLGDWEVIIQCVTFALNCDYTGIMGNALDNVTELGNTILWDKCESHDSATQLLKARLMTEYDVTRNIVRNCYGGDIIHDLFKYLIHDYIDYYILSELFLTSDFVSG